MQFIVGTSGYSYPKWKGKFYPEKLPAKQLLQFYSQQFPGVELNNTFRKVPTAAAFKRWQREVTADFQFAIKAPQKVTHIKRLKEEADETVAALFKALAPLPKRQLGPILYQLPPNFKLDLPRLDAFIKRVKKRKALAAFEFRHESWFVDEVYACLRKHGCALCAADMQDVASAPPLVATAKFGYVRLRRDNYSPRQLKAWLAKLRAMPWEKCYVFFMHDEVGNGAIMAQKFLKLVARRVSEGKTRTVSLFLA